MNQQAHLLAAMVKQFGQQVEDGRAYEVIIQGSTLVDIREGKFEHSTTPVNRTNNLVFRYRPDGPTIDGGKLEFLPEKEALTKWVSPEGHGYEVGIDVGEGDVGVPQKEESGSLDS